MIGIDPPGTQPPDLAGVPVRYRLAPLVALLVLAMVPLVALGALLVWSDSEADQHEAAAASEPEIIEPASVTPGPALTTTMLAYRRVPATLASLGARNELTTAMEQLAAFIDARSCLAVSVNGLPVGSWNGKVAVIPASTNKLLVAGAAIEILGPDHRFTTSVAAPAAVEGVVEGDVYLVGGGDPLLVATDFPPDEGEAVPDPAATTDLDALADAVVGAGITSIRGSIVGDGTRYDDVAVNPAWADGIAYVDAGPIGGLLVNDGRSVGRFGRQRDAGEVAAREFARLLGDRGVRISGGWESGVLAPGTPVIATVESAPLSTITADMLTRSDNDTAEMLLKEIGVVGAGAGTTEAGLQVLDTTVRSWNVPMDGVVFADGSGLSAGNRLTCDTLIGVLGHLHDTPAAEGLAVAGRSGTLIDEFVDSPVESRLVAKTGTLENPPADADPPEVKALAGYLEAPNGDLIEFALVLNGSGVVSADGYVPFWSALAERLVSHPAGPDVAALGPR